MEVKIKLEQTGNYVYEKTPHAIKTVEDVCSKIKNLKYPLTSSVYCYNYTHGNFKELVYGKILNGKIKSFFYYVNIPLYISDLKKMKSGDLFKGRVDQIAYDISSCVHLSIDYIFRIYSFSLTVFAKMQEIPYKKGIEKLISATNTINNFFMVVSLGRGSVLKLRDMYYDPSKRTTKNISKVLVTASLTLVVAGGLLGIETVKFGPTIALNILTIGDFAVQMSNPLYYLGKRLSGRIHSLMYQTEKTSALPA